MKNLLLTCAFMFVAAFANAQFYVGGGIGFKESKSITDEKTQTFTFSPELGYYVNDKLAVGATLSFTTQKDTYTEYSLEPYIRYNFFKSGDFSIFADAFVAVGNIDIENDDTHFAWGAGVSPGISYNFTKHFTALAHIGLLSYMDCKDILKTTNVALDCNDISFSLYYNF